MPRSPSYSPSRRYSPERGRGGSRGDGRDSRSLRDERTSLLVRNLPRDVRPEEVRDVFEEFGRIKDVYLPKDFYSGVPKGFGFVEFYDGADAKEAQYYKDRTMFGGREITVVFAQENRKRPQDMRIRDRGTSQRGYGGGYGYGSDRSDRRRSPGGYSPRSRSPRRHSPSPVRRRNRLSGSPPATSPHRERSLPPRGDSPPPPRRGKSPSASPARDSPPLSPDRDGDRSPVDP